MEEILQIIPADGWVVAYADKGEDDGFYVVPVICFALIRVIDGDIDTNVIRPMTKDGNIDIVEEDGNTDNYLGLFLSGRDDWSKIAHLASEYNETNG